MKEEIYNTLNAIVQTFHKQAPSDFNSFPVAIYYFLSNTPLVTADNTFFDHRRVVFNVDVYDESIVDELGAQITSAFKDKKAILRNETDISDNEVFGVRLEFELFDIK